MSLPAWHVLTVEDEAMIRMLTVDMLEDLGMTSVEAGSAAEAVAALTEDTPTIDAALVDLGLPDRSGQDLIQDLRALRPDLPIIVVTGRDQSALSPATRALANLAFMEKPFEMRHLSQALEKVGAQVASE